MPTVTLDPEHTVTGYLSIDHDRLDDLLAEVTDLMAAGHGEEAARIVAGFAAGLRRHIRLEDELLFPTFDRLTGMTGGPTTVMREEHRAIEGFLTALVDAVERHDRAGFAREKADLIGVLGDHNAKEEAIVYPMTDSHLPEDERRRLVATLRGFR
jgi:hemerythrin-like domain-containing protein